MRLLLRFGFHHRFCFGADQAISLEFVILLPSFDDSNGLYHMEKLRFTVRTLAAVFPDKSVAV